MHKTVMMITILIVKISQNPIVSIKTMWHWIGKNHARNLTKMHKNIHIKRKNWHTYFLSILTWKIIIKQSRMHQETHSNFLGIFAKNLTRIEVQIASIRVHIARKLKKLKESQSLRVKSPNPRIWWIWITRTPLGRWIDPDPSGSRSEGQEQKRVGRVWVDPTQARV